jgi:shikimate kinase
MLEQRGRLYAQVAEIRISTDGQSPAQVADAVLSGLGVRGAAR